MFDDLNQNTKKSDSQTNQGGFSSGAKESNQRVTKQNSASEQGFPSLSPHPKEKKSNLSPVDDIFADKSTPKQSPFQDGISPAPEARVIQSQSNMNQTTAPYTAEVPKQQQNKIIVFVLMLLSLALVAVVGVYAYKMFFASITENVEKSPSLGVDIIEEDDSGQNKGTKEAELPSGETKETALPEDTDGDGLSDAEELDLGTDILYADTDGDGLFDREEVKIYKTNPLDSDTDGDGYTDGKEVDGGYNPNGEGKLYNLNN